MNTSMAIEVVVPGLHGGRHVHLEQALAYGMRLLHESEVHSANAILGQRERSLEWCVGQQIRARPLCSVRRIEFARHLPREQKRKRCLIVAGARSDVLLQSLSDAAGPPEHPFLVRRGDEWGFVSAEFIRKGDYLIGERLAEELVQSADRVDAPTRTVSIYVPGTNVYSAEGVWTHNDLPAEVVTSGVAEATAQSTGSGSASASGSTSGSGSGSTSGSSSGSSSGSGSKSSGSSFSSSSGSSSGSASGSSSSGSGGTGTYSI